MKKITLLHCVAFGSWQLHIAFGLLAIVTVTSHSRGAEALGVWADPASAGNAAMETARMEDPNIATNALTLVAKVKYYRSQAFLDHLEENGSPPGKGDSSVIWRLSTDVTELDVMKDRSGHIVYVRLLTFSDAKKTKEELSGGYDIYYGPVGMPTKIRRRDAKEVMTFHENGAPRDYLVNTGDDQWREVKWDSSGSLLADKSGTARSVFQDRK